jgi:hypothetical protein
MVLGVAERHRRADRSSITLVQLHVDEADPPPPLTHRGHHPHRAGVRRPQEIACHCDRLDCPFAMLLQRRVCTPRQHRAAVHFRADGPMLVQLTFIYAVPAGVSAMASVNTVDPGMRIPS